MQDIHRFNCAICKKESTITLYEIKRGRGITCSRLCANKYAAHRRATKALVDLRKRIESYPQPEANIRHIPMYADRHVVIDLVDLDLAYSASWRIHPGGYAQTSNKEAGTRYVHRLILERKLGRPLSKDEMADHINHDKLDNRRSNLRLATVMLNGANMRVPSHNTSGYKGVFWNTQKSKWCAQIKHRQKTFHIGFYTDLAEAANAYDQFAMELFGEYALTNFQYTIDRTSELLHTGDIN